MVRLIIILFVSLVMTMMLTFTHANGQRSTKLVVIITCDGGDDLSKPLLPTNVDSTQERFLNLPACDADPQRKNSCAGCIEAVLNQISGPVELQTIPQSSANEASAIGSLRTIVSAQTDY